MSRAVLLVLPLLAACSAGSSGSAPASTTASTPPATGAAVTTQSTVPATLAATTPSTLPPTSVAPKGPATAALDFTGDAGLAGASTKPVISCNAPAIDGTVVLRVLAQPAEPSDLFNITITATKISILVGTGGGTGFRARTFEGTGISDFDPAKGVAIDSPLTEIAMPGTNPGSVGAITSIKGSIDCGNQTTGTSTMVFTGDTDEGAVSVGPNPFRVECNTASSGNFVSVVGVITVGSTKAFFFTTLYADSINVFESIAGPPAVTHHYVLKAPGAATLTATGAHVQADLVEQPPLTGTAHTVHVEGDVTCGATVAR